MKVEGTPFQNSTTCKGVTFAATDAPLDIAKITISGRYPETGWAMNESLTEMVYVSRGTGQLVLHNGESIALATDQSVVVHPHQWFAWQGDMEIIMACSPAFNAQQYHIKEEV